MSDPLLTEVQVKLTRAQALVLFEFLARESEHDGLSIADPAEQQVLWVIECQLEKLLDEILAPNYKDVLIKARAEVTSEY